MKIEQLLVRCIENDDNDAMACIVENICPILDCPLNGLYPSVEIDFMPERIGGRSIKIKLHIDHGYDSPVKSPKKIDAYLKSIVDPDGDPIFTMVIIAIETEYNSYLHPLDD